MESAMTKIVLLLTCLAAVAVWAEPLNRGERDRAMSELHATRKRFLDSIAGLSQAQWNFKPAPEVWSIAQIADHLVVSEGELFDRIQKTILTSPAKRDAKKVTDEQVLKVMPDRSQKRKAPDFLAPAGKWATRDAAASEFTRLRDAHIAYADQTQDDLRAHFGEHRAVGELDAYQWLLVISAHTERHVLQIEEVKANGKYPKK
jgi:uncharacterized damage-inducible protein DinB